MATLHNRERDLDDYRSTRQDDREISLGVGTILGIFFALALLCAVFFGFGYSMGRKSLQPTSAVAADAGTSSPSGIFSSFKPSAGSPASQSPSSALVKKDDGVATAETPKDPDAEIVTSAVTEPVQASSKSKQSLTSARNTTAISAEDSPASAPVVVRQPPKTNTALAAAASMPTPTPNGTMMVQIAAVSHQEDADVLIAALKKRGYEVFIRQEPQDHLLHVQVGPFANRKDADAMRQRLLTDGYNAIVK